MAGKVQKFAADIFLTLPDLAWGVSYIHLTLPTKKEGYTSAGSD